MCVISFFSSESMAIAAAAAAAADSKSGAINVDEALQIIDTDFIGPLQAAYRSRLYDDDKKKKEHEPTPLPDHAYTSCYRLIFNICADIANGGRVNEHDVDKVETKWVTTCRGFAREPLPLLENVLRRGAETFSSGGNAERASLDSLHRLLYYREMFKDVVQDLRRGFQYLVSTLSFPDRVCV